MTHFLISTIQNELLQIKTYLKLKPGELSFVHNSCLRNFAQWSAESLLCSVQ